MALKEWMITNPKLSIIFISFTVTLIITLINKFFTNQERIKEIKKRQKEIQEKIKEHTKRNEKDKILELQKEILDGSMELFKHSLKPLIISLIPILLIFWWIKDVYSTTTIAKSWIWYYIVSAIIFSIILRKILDVA
jgi:uncharacterized membrane protein (DUF106 family)